MGWTLVQGDCLAVLPTLAENSVDTVITDPPYGLSFMGKDWDRCVPGVPFWREALRVARPGALLLAFGGTRTFHRLTCAIEDAGWQVRDCLMWLHGGGLPKSHDISKAIDKAAGAERVTVGAINRAPFGYEDRPWQHATDASMSPVTAPATPAAQTWQGWGTALKPAWEPIILAMKPLDGTFANNAQRWGVAGLNVDGGRIEVQEQKGRPLRLPLGDLPSGGIYGQGLNGSRAIGETSLGRWPANVLLDEEAAAALDAQSGVSRSNGFRSGGRRPATHEGYQCRNKTMFQDKTDWRGVTDTGGASRFFYVAKASRAERNEGLEGMDQVKVSIGDERPSGGSWERRGSGKAGGPQANTHPTVKPLALMRYLCRLTATPTGGVVLDPFMGSGTTGVAAVMEGREFIGVESDARYFEIAKGRIEAAQPG